MLSAALNASTEDFNTERLLWFPPIDLSRAGGFNKWPPITEFLNSFDAPNCSRSIREP